MDAMFADRADAGRRLASALAAYRGRDGLLVLALPRGGVPVAAEVARALSAELDVLVVRKLGAPFNPELAIGAIASGGALYSNSRILRMAGITDAEFEAVLAREREELVRREASYRAGRNALTWKGRCVIAVDDGVATGATLRIALRAIRAGGAVRTVAAVPVASSDVAADLANEADEVVTVLRPPYLQSVGEFYRDFSQVSDAQVEALLLRPSTAG